MSAYSVARLDRSMITKVLELANPIIRTLQKWEQGERDPNGASHPLLREMEKEHEAVKRALHG